MDLKVNGRIFPLWVLKNFKKYKLEPFATDVKDVCSGEVKLEVHKYQEFAAAYLGPNSPFRDLLVYHAPGTGKTITAINIFNVVYTDDPNINVIILIRAALREDPWMHDLKLWLGDRFADKIRVVHFVNYDAPNADRMFLETVRGLDLNMPIIYIIDEVHNFIRNVYHNRKTSGVRAQKIYHFIQEQKRDLPTKTRIILLSATPAVNTPFELALLFNLLRPGIFPTSESEFNQIFITGTTYPILNPARRNLFERRILGLVSYYAGKPPGVFARQSLKYIVLTMTDYQYQIYHHFEKLERGSKIYRTYTRQAANFVFPYISADINGENRPRPGHYRVGEYTAQKYQEGRKKNFTSEEADVLAVYVQKLQEFIRVTQDYFKNIFDEDLKKSRSILDDLEDFRKGYSQEYSNSFLNFYRSKKPRSKLFQILYECSPKITAIIFLTYISPGKVMIYSNFVVAEGLEMVRIYLETIGFRNYQNAPENMGYAEYHGLVDLEKREQIRRDFNDVSNAIGQKCRVILLSPSATEGINLMDIRQEHILEPHWNEVRIEQVIGRGLRRCSHRNLPIDQRTLEIYRYHVIKPEKLDEDDHVRWTTDEYIESLARMKHNLIESFLGALREVAVDCELFRTHNMVQQSYPCFKFPENMLHGPAYHMEIKEDLKYASGLHAPNTRVERIRVIKINGVTQNDSTPRPYWFNPKTGMVYDYDTHFPVGRVEIINGIPNKIDKDLYIISEVISVP